MGAQSTVVGRPGPPIFRATGPDHCHRASIPLPSPSGCPRLCLFCRRGRDQPAVTISGSTPVENLHRTRQLGTGGPWVSPLGVGFMSFRTGAAPEDERAVHEVVDAALDAGISFFDTADV
ncbi:aldo/keto reductase [Nocardia testacea]|uniref:Aldo/keto reductase n=1 Tax=Nocardia testacea TaxID=248551 RepID=A0ABW7VY41_9NOCA